MATPKFRHDLRATLALLKQHRPLAKGAAYPRSAILIFLGFILLAPGPSVFGTRERFVDGREFVSQPRTPNRDLQRRPDVIYYATPPETVAEMLRLANIQKGDVLYDLGSGDGRIPIMAAREYGIRAVGIEIDPKLIAIAEEQARLAGVADLVKFRNANMFRANIREASIVTLYLSDRINELLRPKLLRELKPGARIVSHDFRMGDWEPEQTVKVPWEKLYRTIYLWTVPRRNTR
ncbi:MAG TPA: class I SAM-dependent methyltransferase [Pyrinomonadaceae bacterium]|nr:class I SAM-dependent methyltransferase [Pyrinomonadaceae bacterium]